MKKDKRILIVGSSSAMPRAEVDYEDTWSYHLSQEKGFEVITSMRRASTSQRLVKEGGGYKGAEPGADLLEYYNPDYVITQIGITDCAPRYLKPNGIIEIFINRSPAPIKSFLYRQVKKYLTRSPTKVDVPLALFTDNYKKYFERALVTNVKVVVILIAKPSKIFTKKSPYIGVNVDKYNAQLIKLSLEFSNVTLITPFDTEQEINDCLIDEFHYDKKGHQIITNKLVKALNS